jgi:predicted GIY-YIG superfamily endonuclease
MNDSIRADIRANTHVLYRFFDRNNKLLYVGITNDASRRFGEHGAEKPWWNRVEEIKLERFPTRQALTAAETHAIETERPKYNIAGVVVPLETTHKSRTGVSNTLSDANRFGNTLPAGAPHTLTDEPRRLTAGGGAYACPACGQVFCMYRDADEKWQPANELIHCSECGKTWTEREYEKAAFHL